MKSIKLDSEMGDHYIHIINDDGSVIELDFSGNQFECLTVTDAEGQRKFSNFNLEVVEPTPAWMEHG